jgi:hypothetical protein
MAKGPSPQDRLTQGIASVLADLPGNTFDGELGDLWMQVKKAVSTRQKQGQKEARAEGKEGKLDASITWMGTGERALIAFEEDLRRKPLGLALKVKGYEMKFSGGPDSLRVQIIPDVATADAATDEPIEAPSPD